MLPGFCFDVFCFEMIKWFIYFEISVKISVRGVME